MPGEQKTIGIVSTMDTKGEECAFLKNQIEKLGCKTLIIDVGVMGEPQIKSDITREEIAKAGGEELADLQEAAKAGAERAGATEVMVEGVEELLADAYEKGSLHAMVGLGGSTGSSIAVEAMRAIPSDAPKLLLTTVADLQDVDDEDGIAVFQTPCDIMGMNSILKNSLSQAVGAILGMIEAENNKFYVNEFQKHIDDNFEAAKAMNPEIQKAYIIHKNVKDILTKEKIKKYGIVPSGFHGSEDKDDWHIAWKAISYKYVKEAKNELKKRDQHGFILCFDLEKQPEGLEWILNTMKKYWDIEYTKEELREFGLSKKVIKIFQTQKEQK
jgi:hypothetical protein